MLDFDACCACSVLVGAGGKGKAHGTSDFLRLDVKYSHPCQTPPGCGELKVFAHCRRPPSPSRAIGEIERLGMFMVNYSKHDLIKYESIVDV